MTKTVDSVFSDILQDNPAVEYVEPRENPIALKEKSDSVTQGAKDSTGLELVFGQTHNGIECALCPTAKRACDRVWFSAKQIENWSEMSTTTLWRWLGRLENARRISSFSDMKKTSIPDSNGVPHETTFYNLNVLNQLAMACIDNEKLNDISCKFSDMLSEKETEMMSGTQTPMMCLPQDYESALEALLAKVRENKALQAEKKHIAAERDEAVARKAEISSRREATAVGILNGVRTRELNLIAQTKVDSYGLPQKSMMFTTDEVIDTDWFQSLFKASTNPFFHEGQEAWKQNRRALKSFLTRRANEQVQADIVTKLGDVVTRKVARSIFAAWRNSKTSSVTFESSMEENGLYNYIVKSRVIMADLIALRTRYEYRRADGDKSIGIEYEYSYDVWSRVLSSPDFLSIARSHLRDGISIYDYTRTFNDAKSEGFGLRHLINEES